MTEKQSATVNTSPMAKVAVPVATVEAPRPRPIGDMLDFDELHIEFAPDLVSMALDPATGLEARVGNMRAHVAASYGFILPEIRLTDEASLPPGKPDAIPHCPHGELLDLFAEHLPMLPQPQPSASRAAAGGGHPRLAPK